MYTDTDHFQADVIESDSPVLVRLTASWCGPCRALTPVLDSLANDKPELKIFDLDVDKDPLLANKYGVQSVPTIIKFSNGEEVNRLTGAFPKAKIVAEFSL